MQKKPFGRLIWAVLLATFGCALGCGSSNRTTSFNGSVQGIRLNQPNAFYRPLDNSNVLSRNRVEVLITDDADACSHLIPLSDGRTGVSDGQGGRKPSMYVTMESHNTFYANDRHIPKSMTALFDVGCTHPTDVLDVDAGSCTDPELTATVGSGEIDGDDDTTAANGSAQGTFDVTFNTDRVVGSFHATNCPQLQATTCASVGNDIALWALVAGAGAGVVRRRRRHHG
jgi:hypothetical protein